MSLTPTDLARALTEQLDAGSTIPALSQWAYKLHAEHAKGLAPDLRDLLLELGGMEDGPAFEYSRDELYALAAELGAAG